MEVKAYLEAVMTIDPGKRAEASGVYAKYCAPFLDGFMGLNPDARPGFSEIRIVPHISCDAPEDEARAFVEFVEMRCPVSDNLSNGVPITRAGVVVE